MTFINYYEYIKSPEWFARTETVRKRNNGRCECCMMRQASSVHHRTYERLGNEDDSDLIHLCDICHGVIHKKREGFIWESRRAFRNQLAMEVEAHAKQSPQTENANNGKSSDTPW